MQTTAGFGARIVDRERMGELLPQWQRLADTAAEDNVYYAPPYATVLLETVAAAQAVRFLVVSQGEALVALLPFTRSRLPGSPARGWETPYTFNGIPLLARDGTQAVAAALVEACRDLVGGTWILPTLRVGGPAHAALTQALAEAGAVHRDLFPFGRALLERGASFEQHMAEAVGAKRRRELGRGLRKLAERGAVTFETHVEGEGLARAVETFLELERSGWKGRKGTALACSEPTRQFALRAFAGGARTRVDLLCLDGRALAAGVIVFCGRTGFTVKGAYDEDFARYGAGLQLEVHVIRSFLSEGWADRLDAATAGGHVIDMLWPGCMAMADLAFSFSPVAPALRIDLFERAAMAGRRLRSRVKQALKLD